jgi:hypothetical protein
MCTLEGLDFFGVRTLEQLSALVSLRLICPVLRRRGGGVLSRCLHSALLQLALQIGDLLASFHDLRLQARQS